VKVLPIEITDLDKLTEIQPPDWRDIIPHVEYYINSPHCSPIKVVEDDKIIGTGVAIRHEGTAWLALIIVHPEHRNRGLGRFITQQLIDILKAENIETIYLIATPMGESVYTKLGFEIETEQIFYKGEKVEANLSPNIVGFEEKYRESIYALDALAYGENRQYRLDEHLQKGQVYITNGKVEGFYLPTLVEGLIVASSEEAGLALMQMRMKTNDIAILPVENIAGNEFLKQNGFVQFKTAKRMRLGKERPVNSAMVYNRVGGQIG
jgi:ribosomal protein S18 acetylase RimI-like enzyme